MSVMSEVVSHQLHAMSQPEAFDKSIGLLEARAAEEAIKRFVLDHCDLGAGAASVILISCSARVPPMTVVRKGDVVLLRSVDGINFVAGQIWLLLSIDASFDFALVSLWQLKSTNEPSRPTWRMEDAPASASLCDILCPAIWSESSPSEASTLIPIQFRGSAPVAL